MARSKAKLPAKEKPAAKVAGVVSPTADAGFIVVFKGEQIKLRLSVYGNFKKTLAAAVDMQNKDPHFTWEYMDQLPL